MTLSHEEDLAMPHLRRALALAAVLTLALLQPCPAGELRRIDTMPAPALELPDLAGVPRTLTGWRGQVVLLNFWASWCQPCVEEMPSIQRLAARMSGRPFAVVGINVAETQRRAERIVAELGLTFPTLLDSQGNAFHAWGGKALPTSALIDRQGALRYVGLGPLEWDDAEEVTAIEGLLEEGAPTGPAVNDLARPISGSEPGARADNPIDNRGPSQIRPDASQTANH
jgi:thiol-disulfide isomerase/thioredoxin